MTRIQFKFWLDDTKADEQELIAIIERWKNQRKFTKAVRDGLYLYWSCEQGSTQALQELYPKLQAQSIVHNVDSLQAEREALQAEREALQREREKLESITAQLSQLTQNKPTMGFTNARGQGLKSASDDNAPKTLNVPTFTAPTFDDDSDDDLLTIRKDTSTNANQNLIKSIMGLIGEKK